MSSWRQGLLRTRTSLLLASLAAPILGYLAMEHAPVQFLHTWKHAELWTLGGWLVVASLLGFGYSLLWPRYWLLWAPLLVVGDFFFFVVEMITGDPTMWPLGLLLRASWVVAAFLGAFSGWLLSTLLAVLRRRANEG